MAQSNTKLCPTCRKVQIMPDVDVCAACSNKGRVAQSNGDELEQLHKDIAEAFQRYALSESAQYHDRTGAGFRMEAEHFVLRAQSLMHKWEKQDRKQHELDARITELESHIKQCGDTEVSSYGEGVVYSGARRIAELKAERERLGK